MGDKYHFRAILRGMTQDELARLAIECVDRLEHPALEGVWFGLADEDRAFLTGLSKEACMDCGIQTTRVYGHQCEACSQKSS